MTESKLLFQQKSIVVPGEVIAEGMDYLPSFGTYRDGDSIRADRVGIVQIEGKVIKLIPIRGYYHPKRGDTVIGRVEEIFIAGWRVDINCAYTAVLTIKDATSDFINRGADLSQYFEVGDMIVAKVSNISAKRLIDLSLKGPGLKKLEGGRVFGVNPLKVPRIIGKQGSMISMIKHATGCNVVVGQNGLIWIMGEPRMELIAVEAITTIERNSHTTGLTDVVKAFLEQKTGKKVTGEHDERSDI